MHMVRASKLRTVEERGKEALVTKPRGKLTVHGRELLVERITKLGYPVARAAEMQGVSRSCAYHWLRRWRAEGEAGLEDRSCRPHTSPRRLAPRWSSASWRPEPGSSSDRTSSAGGWCAALHGLHGAAPPRRQPARPHGPAHRPGGALPAAAARRAGPRRREKLGRIPDGGGWRAHGRASATPRSRGSLGYDFLHVAVDDATRLAYVEVLDDERGQACAAFLQRAGAWFAEHGVVIGRVMTDNGLRLPALARVR